MYSTLLPIHSIVRWLVLIMLVWSIINSLVALKKQSAFTKRDNALRHWTATVAHIQLMIGILLYTKSPLVKLFWHTTNQAVHDPFFFSIDHLVMMIGAIVLLTVGSAKAKRESTDQAKFKTISIYYAIALFIILLAIPWPFSPLASRPYFRLF